MERKKNAKEIGCRGELPFRVPREEMRRTGGDRTGGRTATQKWRKVGEKNFLQNDEKTRFDNQGRSRSFRGIRVLKKGRAEDVIKKKLHE